MGSLRADARPAHGLVTLREQRSLQGGDFRESRPMVGCVVSCAPTVTLRAMGQQPRFTDDQSSACPIFPANQAHLEASGQAGALYHTHAVPVTASLRERVTAHCPPTAKRPLLAVDPREPSLTMSWKATVFASGTFSSRSHADNNKAIVVRG